MVKIIAPGQSTDIKTSMSDHELGRALADLDLKNVPPFARKKVILARLGEIMVNRALPTERSKQAFQEVENTYWERKMGLVQ